MKRDAGPTINPERLWRSIEDMAKIGALSHGGSRRLSLSDEDRAARDLFASWCVAAGCEMHVDSFGNQFAVRKGRTSGAPVVLFGSHLDTQPNGGRFDGIYGVLGGLEVMRTLRDHGVETDCALAVVNWTNEEGVRFAPGLTGSKGFAGQLSVSEVDAILSTEGTTFREELQRIGYSGTPLPHSIKAYVEAHIEQGPILEAAGLPVGVVTGVQGVKWFDVEVTGSDRHAGTTPMELRADSFMATAAIALHLRDELLRLASDIRFTVGRVAVQPGSINTVPGRTVFTIDLRHPSTAVLEEAETLIGECVRDVARSAQCEGNVKKVFDLPPVDFEAGVIRQINAAVESEGLTAMTLVSGAMHDACALSTVAPTAMIFTSCKGGVSHSEEEFAEPGALAAGCQVLLRTVLGLAQDK
jgi:N-carbamoyl-L-amino-acid hydrolase